MSGKKIFPAAARHSIVANMTDRIASTFLDASVDHLVRVLRVSAGNAHMIRLALKRGRAIPLRHLVVWAAQMDPPPSKEELWDHAARRLGAAGRTKHRNKRSKKEAVK